MKKLLGFCLTLFTLCSVAQDITHNVEERILEYPTLGGAYFDTNAAVAACKAQGYSIAVVLEENRQPSNIQVWSATDYTGSVIKRVDRSNGRSPYIAKLSCLRPR